MGLPVDGSKRRAPGDGPGNVLDLGGLRAGGVTHWLSLLEDEDFAMRQGGWMDKTSMNLYVQEFVAVSILPTLTVPVRDKVLCWADATPLLMKMSSVLLRARVPATHWGKLLRSASAPPASTLAIGSQLEEASDRRERRHACFRQS